MRFLRGFALALFACGFVLPCFAQKPGVVIANSPSKELKRAAHRLRIPVGQLKDAREALQLATVLAGKMEPYPADQLLNLAQMWEQVERRKAETVVKSFVRELRSRAAECQDFGCYQKYTSSAMMLMQSKFDYAEVLAELESWPEPKESSGGQAGIFLDRMKSQFKKQSIYRLASSDPERALELLTEARDSGKYGYSASAQIAQSLMQAGKREQALDLIDQTIGRFDETSADGRALQEFENFVRMTAMNLDSARAGTAMNRLITALSSERQNDPAHCNATLQSGETSVGLTCSESRLLNLLRSNPMRPSFTMKTLDSLPALKAKLDSVGGIDSLYGSGMYGAPQASITYGAWDGTHAIQGGVNSAPPDAPGKPPVNIAGLIQSLKGKAESDPSLARGKIKDLDMEALLGLAMSASYQDPDLAEMAIEMAQKRLPELQPLQTRAGALQNLVRSARQVNGEVDAGLLRDGFILADQLREEIDEKAPEAGITNKRYLYAGAEQLEAFLVAELSRDDFDSAIEYARSLDDDALKLNCLIQIAQAQAQQNY